MTGRGEEGAVLSVLAVDDDAVDRAAVRRALRATGLEVELTEAADAPEALAALRRGGFDCALLDFRLPKADGLAVLGRARDEGLTTPIVMLTGHGDEQLAVDLMKAGAHDYIAKGALTPERLRSSILQAVRVGRAEAAFAAERRRTARMQSFLATLASTRTVPEVARAVVREGLATFDAARGLLAVLAEGDTALEVLAIEGYPDEVVDRWRRIPLDVDLPLVNVLATREPEVFGDRAAFEARYAHMASSRYAGDAALAAVPLVVSGRALGSVGLSYERPRRFADEAGRELVAFARVCAQALERAQLFDLAQAERRRAAEANQAKDEFLAVVSHELRTPLNAILGWSKMLTSGSLDDDQARRAVEAIERNARSQAQLIEDLLDLSRIITGKLRIDPASVDLAAVLEAALDVVRPAADAKGVRLQAVLDRGLGPVVGDAERLQQVFWNLLSNAVKFTRRGGRVFVRLERVDSSVVVAVEDTGEGIAPEFLPYVFVRFRQQDGGPARKAGGLGLGLAIVRHIVELHGGRVEVASEGAGRGATFFVRLPVSAARAAEPLAPPSGPAAVGAPASAGAPAPSCPPALDGLRVLVVDDEADARDLVAYVLRHCRADVTVVSTAAEALERLRAEPPHVLVSDVGMPVDDGYALIERVRALPPEEGGRTPAVALTAYARTEDRTRALLAGFTMHVAKPVDPNELALVVASVAGRSA
jgi:signal transduction histidine kinase/DNA-binding response OmpR family regulator